MVHERQHKCEKCGKAFGLSSYLKEHIKVVHEGQKNYECYECGKSFGFPGNFKQHVKAVHRS